MIPKIPRGVTKEALKVEMNKLQEEKEALQEKLFLSGVEHRPTMMNQIVEKETITRTLIDNLIEDCEKTTGRKFLLSPVGYVESYPYKLGKQWGKNYL